MTTLLGTSAAIRPVTVTSAVLAGIGVVLGLQVLAMLAATGGHLVYAIEAPYTHLALAQQIAQGHYGLTSGESSAPSSSILFPVLLAGLLKLGLGATAPLLINLASTLATGLFAVLLAEECGLPLARLGWAKLCLLSVSVTLALNLAGLAMTGLEHSLHVTLTVAYLLGLVRFARRGRCDWWWFACIIIQPLLRFEAAGMLVADVAIFLAFRRYSYAVLTVALALALLGGYSLFLHSLGLPLLPTSVLSRSDWSEAAVADHAGLMAVFAGILRNFIENLNSFGAAQILGVAALCWFRLDFKDRTRLMTAFFVTFVSLAQLAGGKIGSAPPRYEAYVLALGLCGLMVIHGEAVIAWCAAADWKRVGAVSAALLVFYAGYATQTAMAPALARKEYLGPYQVHRFVNEFYQAPVADNRPGYVLFDQPYYVLDLSGLASEKARLGRAAGRGVVWMDELLAAHDIGLAIVDPGDDPMVPAGWTPIGDLRASNGTTLHATFYARRPEDVPAIDAALTRFAATLPPGARLVRLAP